MDVITAFHDSAEVHSLLSSVAATQLATDLGMVHEDSGDPILKARLRSVAMVALSQLLGSPDVDARLKSLGTGDEASEFTEGSLPVFRKWSGYLSCVLDSGSIPSIDDLLSYVATGLLSKCNTEVRSMLQHTVINSLLNDSILSTEEIDWPNRVRNDVALALMYLVRQRHHSDVAKAGEIIKRLSADQKNVEETWLAHQSPASRGPLFLLGFYHLAQAVIRTSEFLLSGAVANESRLTVDFAPELRRLLIRAEEYLSLARDLEPLFWLNIVTIVLWKLRLDSIWVSARGISERMDNLITELAREGREHPIFSLLPSQQEALRNSLLDPAQVAVILQMPTSAGKTLLAEFSIVQAFEAYKREARVVYIVPTRALATQTRRTLTEDLGPIDISVSAAGSAFEEDPFELHLLTEADGVVVATPEKLDLLLRAHSSWFDTLRLVVVDEAHLLRDGERGVRLELLLANLRREQPQARLLLLTPFMDNAQEIATWIGSIGGKRAVPIRVHWRPSIVLVGLARFVRKSRASRVTIDWKSPHSKSDPLPLNLNVDPSLVFKNSIEKVVYLSKRFRPLGTVLGMFSLSRTHAEKAAKAVATDRDLIPVNERSATLRICIALARDEFGIEATLPFCLERGVAYHHSSLSGILRYLVEDQIRNRQIDFVAATSTLAQGMNFPVSTVLVHSVNKPYAGDLTASEFWNIAGRAGRIGLAEQGFVIFVNEKHEQKWQEYCETLSDSLQSALLVALSKVSNTNDLKSQYKNLPPLRPFMQYLAHAAAKSSPLIAMADLDELLQASLANAQAANSEDARTLRSVARSYLQGILGRKQGYLSAADSTGLGSFSFDELFAKIADDQVLRNGPDEVLRLGQIGIGSLINVLQWLPELSLGIGRGSGQMSVEAVAAVVQGWMDGKPIREIATNFDGKDTAEKTRNATRYLYGTVSQIVSWGAHAYLKGWGLQSSGAVHTPTGTMLPAYIQYGVNTPEAAVASLLGIPRQFAEAFGQVYRAPNGELTPDAASYFKSFIDNADTNTWADVVSLSPVSGQIDPQEMRSVWRQMQGLKD